MGSVQQLGTFAPVGLLQQPGTGTGYKIRSLALLLNNVLCLFLHQKGKGAKSFPSFLLPGNDAKDK